MMYVTGPKLKWLRGRYRKGDQTEGVISLNRKDFYLYPSTQKNGVSGQLPFRYSRFAAQLQE